MEMALFDRVIETLWPPGVPSGSSVWAILDAARDERIHQALRLSRLEYLSLYAGKLPDALQRAAPYLIELAPSYKFTRPLLEMGWGNSWGVFLRVKDARNLRHHLRSFLRDPRLAADYDGGALVISRLSLQDYHHFHFPDSGVPGDAVAIPGMLHAGGPYAIREVVPYYSENHRVVTPFDSDHFGRMLIVEIGAMTVGSIRQTHQAGVRVFKGERKGFFGLGGSTVVLLFKPGFMAFDEDILSNTGTGMETYILMGDSIGRQSGRCDAFYRIQGEKR